MDNIPPVNPEENQASVSQAEPAPVAEPQIQIKPVPADESVAPKKILSPEEKKALRKAMLKRLGIVSGAVYLVLLIGVFAWAGLAAGKELTLFDYLPLTQAGMNNFIFSLFNIMWGLLVFAGVGVGLFGFARMALAKKDEIEKKKKGKKIGIIGGAAFALLAVSWLAGLWFLGPKLVTEVHNGIVTSPTNTLGLTAPVEIVFDASYLPIVQDYQIISYTWTFGDGDTANGQTVSHRYTQKGTTDGRYTVTLDVDYNGPNGETEALYYTEISIDNEQVAAYFSAVPDSGEVPLEVNFDASGSYDPDGEIIAYEWDLDGDGLYDDAEGEELDYEFIQEGEFEVSLRVTDNNGDYNTYTRTIETGSVGGLRAVITPELSEGEYYYAGEKYEFTGELSQYRDSNIVKYTWDFGDGETIQSRSITHSFDSSGEHEVTLTVQDGEGNEDSATLELIVVDDGAVPVANISADTQSGTVPLTVIFDGSGSTDVDGDIVQYAWDFDGDGEIDEAGDVVTYIYGEAGIYNASLIVTDSAGNTGGDSIEIGVEEQGITAVLEADLTSGEVPLTVEFDASGSSYREGEIVSYEYDFGDGQTYTGNSSISYKYTTVGTYTASITVVGDDGTTDTAETVITIRPVSLTSCFTVNTNSGTAPVYLSVDPSCSTGTISSYEWDFGDDEISFDRKPEIHVYDTPGTYTVTLEVSEESGVLDSFSNTITVK
jgi:PKD repeat protein